MFEDKDYPVKRGNDGEFKALKHVLFQNGDIFTEVEGWKYPYRGFPMDRWVDFIAIIKGIIPSFADFIKYSNKFFLVFQIRAIKGFLEQILEMFGKTILGSEAYPLSKRYCKSVREVYRAFTKYIEKHGNMADVMHGRNNLLWRIFQIRDIICLILEWDNAYRYRFQDIMVLLDRFAFIKNPRKEINRLFDILIERENHQNMKEQWVRIRKMSNLIIIFVRIFYRKYWQIVENIILEFNLNELKFEIDDEYWCDVRKDYNFRGIDHKVKN